MSEPFYTAWAEHYDDVFPVGPKPAFVEQRFPRGGRLLDVGCATGGMAFALTQRGFVVHGVDLDPALVARAELRLAAEPTPGVSFARGDMLELLTPARLFDGVLCLGNTLVHLLERSQRVAALGAMARQVDGGGRLIVQIVNYDRVLARAVARLPLIDNAAVRFERRYHDLGPGGLTFEAELTVKASGQRLSVAQPLYPLTRAALDDELRAAGWTPSEWCGGYGGDIWTPGAFGTIVSAVHR